MRLEVLIPDIDANEDKLPKLAEASFSNTKDVLA